MARAQLSWPLSILAGFAVLIIFMVLGSLEPSAVAQEENDCNPYPTCIRQTETAQADEIKQAFTAQAEADQQTATAFIEICRDDPTAYPGCPSPTSTTRSNTNPGGNTGGNNNNNNNASSPTATFTPTMTTTPTVAGSAAATSQATQAITPTATRTTAAVELSPTPTSLLPAGVPTLVCVPGSTVEITGTTDPDIPLLLFFDDRPVGGGLSDANGNYRLRLQVGEERPGLYLVEVRRRVDRELVDQVGCDVPAGTPTATFTR